MCNDCLANTAQIYSFFGRALFSFHQLALEFCKSLFHMLSFSPQIDDFSIYRRNSVPCFRVHIPSRSTFFLTYLTLTGFSSACFSCLFQRKRLFTNLACESPLSKGWHASPVYGQNHLWRGQTGVSIDPVNYPCHNKVVKNYLSHLTLNISEFYWILSGLNLFAFIFPNFKLTRWVIRSRIFCLWTWWKQHSQLIYRAHQGRSHGGGNPPPRNRKNCCRKLVLFPKALCLVTNFRKIK